VSVPDRIVQALEGLEVRATLAPDGVVLVETARAALHVACRRLRDRCGFETCTFVTAVDRFPAEPRFELLHQLLALPGAERARLRTLLRGDGASAPTVTDLWPGAAFMERECFDMFGIRFEGHAGLKRLLMPEGFPHFPLRKDFPHQGLEPDRLYREWDRARRAAAASEGGA